MSALMFIILHRPAFAQWNPEQCSGTQNSAVGPRTVCDHLLTASPFRRGHQNKSGHRKAQGAWPSLEVAVATALDMLAIG